MAYVLGFFAADGNMIRNRRGACFISFHITDKDVLLKIRSVLGSDHAIGVRLPQKEHWRTGYRLQVGSKDFFEDILRLGLTPHKSLSMKMPLVPKEYFGDFVRGYFDGDGN